jgi:hemerythrin-like metal-binding protein
MPLMTWEASLDVGVETMNREHREILDLMNRLYDAHGAAQTGAGVNTLVDRLGAVCAKHFADEEEFMRKIAFPALIPHKQLHQRLLERYTGYAEQIRANHGRPTDEFFDFLKFWLTSHIKGIDTKYGEHLRRGAAA